MTTRVTTNMIDGLDTFVDNAVEESIGDIENILENSLEAYFGKIVPSTSQSDVLATIAAAGHNGRVFFPPGNYQTDGLTASYDNQIWTMAPGANFQRSNANNNHWLTMDCEGITIIGGKVDVNGTVETRGIMGLAGGDITWRGGELFNATGWGILSHDGEIVLEDMYIHDIGFAALLWQTQQTLGVGQYLQAPIVKRCLIDRRTNYVSSGGILINSGTPAGGGTWARVYRPQIMENRILMPIGGDLYDNVAVEMYFCENGIIANNQVRGSRIAFSNGNGSSMVHVGNSCKDVENYAHEIVDSEYAVVTGNSATGTSSGTPLIAGLVMTGTSRSNVVVGNSFAGGWSTGVLNSSTAPANYGNTIANNAAYIP